MRRVLHVLAGMDAGGIETWLVHVLRKIDHEKLKIDFLVHSNKKCFYDEEVKQTGSCLIHVTQPKSILRYCMQLYRVFSRQEKYDVVHCHLHYFSGVVMLIAWLARVPVRISHSHNDTRLKLKESSLHRKFYVWVMRRLIARFSTCGLACSSLAAEDLFGLNWKSDNRFRVLHCALNIERFKHIYDDSSQVDLLKHNLNIPSDAFIIGHVGSFTEQKNHFFLIEIFKKLLEEVPNSCLLLLGDGPLVEEIKGRVLKEQIKGSVKFLGNRRNVEDFFALFDVFVFPSSWEGLGLVVIESQAAGVPVVASSSIPDDAIICQQLVTRLHLEDSVSSWVESISAVKKIPKNIMAYNSVNGSVFSISNNIKKLLSVWS